ncbi:putative long-chain fatty acyl-AMP ligase [Nocardia brasiliensis NBRC 14402]|uniref:fatty acyl-AMP ligase n=1 Tax=Nocardia brasiliensis TaxID=37326 RepID=UPI000311FADF|nr:fatty acyl-AMP ligase [Nocardia brasiliensis]ASF08043.2 AMP-binding protein [Nocardia brasiliensis]GAJ80902.1 putative long-chain fatty acyl-AMP ligase [Nocardia brasiliensis NBRC 14402]SUB54323.1 Long-chain-fatty-acid--AMP ligase FadD29 [Nocardia brasiliensis]
MTTTLLTGGDIEYDTLVRALTRQAAQHPDRLAYSFLSYPDSTSAIGVTESLTYAEIDRAARAYAATLLQVAHPGDRAVLLLPPGLEYVKAFFGCLYAGIIAVPLYPPSAHNSNGRIDAVCVDADPACLVTTDDALTDVTAWLDNSPTDTTRLIVTTGEVNARLATDWEPVLVDREQIALLQYTSGSTRTPAGVMVPHRGLLANARQTYQMMYHVGVGPEDEIGFVSWLPLFHDMGLMVGVIMPIINGHGVVQMSPTSFLRRPQRWLRAISDHPAQVFAASPNVGYELCAERVGPEELDGIDLSRWRYALSGAEPVRVSTIRKFYAAFAGHGLSESSLIAGYGLAEATLLVSVNWRTLSGVQTVTVDRTALAAGSVVVAPDGADIVSGGAPAPGTAVQIVDPDTREPLPENRLGEIWVHGPSLCSGYFNRPAETEATFRGELSPRDGKYYLRTGDIGFLHDGEVYPTTRLKDLIIIDGRNYYPPDLEDAAEQAHPLVLPGRCSAFSIEVGVQEKIVVLVEARIPADDTATAQELRNAVREAIFRVHDVGVHEVLLLSPGGIPRTSSGKIQRSASRTAYLDGTLRVRGEK